MAHTIRMAPQAADSGELSADTLRAGTNWSQLSYFNKCEKKNIKQTKSYTFVSAT